MVLRRSLALFVVTVVMIVMMAVSPGWAKAGGVRIAAERPTRSSENPPSKERTLSNCGVENNPLFSDKPEGPILVRRPRRNRVLENDLSHQAGRGLPVVCWSGICRLGSIEIGSLGPINTLPFDHKSGSPESLLGLLPDINKPPLQRVAVTLTRTRHAYAGG